MKLKHRNANYKHKLLIYSCCLAYECVIQSGFSRDTTCFNLRLESSEIPSLLCIIVDDVGIFYWHFLKEALLFWCLFFGRHFGPSLGTPSSGRQHVSLCANDAFIIGIPWANLFSHSLLPTDHFSRKLRKKPGQH